MSTSRPVRAPRIPSARLLAGLSLVALAGHAAPALAANECGETVTGSVTCTSAGNPYASGITYVTPGDVSITTNADVVAQGTVSATSTTGMATVTSNGQITTTAATTDGIDATAPGNVTVTAAAVTTSGSGSAGVLAQSTAGAVSLTGGTVTVQATGGAALEALAPGAITITSGTASALNESAVYARSLGGPVTINLTGANSTTTADAAVTAISASTVVINVAAGASAVGINGLVLSPGTTSTITNAGTLTGTSGYAIFAKFGTTTVVNSGTINSAIEFINAGSSLTNNGTFNVTRYSVFGTGAGGTLTNTGLIQVTAAAPTVGLKFYELASFMNSGTLSLANGRAGDLLTVSGSFTGSGTSTLVLDTAPGAAPDQLVIGGAATGVTAVQIVNTGGSGGLLNAGTVIVTAGAGTSAGAFQIAPASATAGFVQYGIVYNAAANTFSLVGTPSEAAYRPLVYAEAARNIWYKTSAAWAAHMGSLRDGTGSGDRLWGQLYGSADTRHDGFSATVFGQSATEDLSYHQSEFGGQLGLDLARPQPGGGVSFGITGGYVGSSLHFPGQAAQAHEDAANIGGYAGFRVSGAFVNLLGQYSHYWIHASDDAIGFDQHFDGEAYGATAEVGFHLGDARFFVEPLATLSYVRTSFDNFTALLSNFTFHDANGWRGKLGARFGTAHDSGTSKLTFYGGANAVKAFAGRDTLVFTNNAIAVALSDNRIGLYGEGYAGLSIASKGGVSGFVEAFGDYGASDTQRGGGGRAGLRIGF
jgi:outer membrane autotransporter protein